MEPREAELHDYSFDVSAWLLARLLNGCLMSLNPKDPNNREKLRMQYGHEKHGMGRLLILNIPAFVCLGLNSAPDEHKIKPSVITGGLQSVKLPYGSMIAASTNHNCGFHFTVGAIPGEALALAEDLDNVEMLADDRYRELELCEVAVARSTQL